MSHAILEEPAKPFVRPSKKPEALAELVSGLSNLQQAEMMYELVFFAALAAEETGHAALNEFLSELESMAEVYTDPEKRRELDHAIRHDLRGGRRAAEQDRSA